MKKIDYNSKDPQFKKINEMLRGGKYTHSMDKQLNNVHKDLNKDKKTY